MSFTGALAIQNEVGGLSLPPLNVFVVIAGAVAIGIYLFYQGYRMQRAAGRIPDPDRASATIERLFRKRTWLWGSCYATVSFSDRNGLRHQTTIGVMRRSWQFLREGGQMAIIYSMRDPEEGLAGRAKGVYTFASWALMAAGAAMASLCTYEFLACSLGWGGAFWVR